MSGVRFSGGNYTCVAFGVTTAGVGGVACAVIAGAVFFKTVGTDFSV